MAKPKTSDIFDVEREELVPAVETTDDMYNDDTMGDPEGAEERARPDAIQLPDYFFKKYALDVDGKPTFNALRVDGIMQVFEDKKDTPVTFAGDNADKEQAYYENQVDTIVQGLLVMCETDPQSTGISFLQLNTRTWAEFASIAYEYKEEAEQANPNEELPTWLIEREERMIGLGRKARMLRDVVAKVDNRFGLNKTALETKRVRTEVERRLQRLADWNYTNVVDQSLKVAIDMNVKSKDHTKSIFDLA